MSEHEIHPSDSFAIDSLKADLFSEVQQVQQNREASFTEKDLVVHHLLFDPIDMPHDVLKSDPYMPTPGDPDRVTIGHNGLFETVAREYRIANLMRAAGRVGVAPDHAPMPIHSGMTGEEYDTVKGEMLTQLEAQTQKNIAGIDRVRNTFLMNPASMRLDDAEKIQKIRMPKATTLERLDAMTDLPALDAVEDLMHTCFMNQASFEAAIKAHDLRLMEMHQDENNPYVVSFIDEDQQEIRPRKLEEGTSSSVRAHKVVTARIYHRDKKNVTFEVVRKINRYSFPKDRELRGTTPFIVNGHNQQPVYVQIVLRLQKDRSKNRHLDPQVAYDIDRQFINKGAKQRHISDSAL